MFLLLRLVFVGHVIVAVFVVIVVVVVPIVVATTAIAVLIPTGIIVVGPHPSHLYLQTIKVTNNKR